MTTELKRMYQRRGLESELPNSPNDGEIYVTLDTENVYIGVSGDLVKLMNLSDVVDNLSTESSNPLSARQGFILQGRIDSFQSFLDNYQIQINQAISDVNNSLSTTNIRMSELETQVNSYQTQINNKQDVVVIKSNTAPSNTDYIWFDTN